MGFGEMPSGEGALNKIEKVTEENWSELKNVQVGEERLEKLLEEGGDEEKMSQCIYTMLTTRSGFVEEREKVNSLAKMMKPFEKQYAWYDKAREEVEKNIREGDKFGCGSNVGWFGVNARPGPKEKEGNDTKIYATIPADEYSFVQNILSLANDLREIADETDDSVQVKFPKGLAEFLAHNDSIVIHFKDKNNVEKIQGALSQWMEKYSITDAPREMGRTKVAVDSKKGGSFSQLVSDNIASWLGENSGKYDNKVLAEMAVKYAIEQSQKSPV